MEKITSWCKIISLISIMSSVVLLLLPESKSKNAFRTLFSFIMIYSFVMSFSDTEADFTKVSHYLNISENKNGYEYYEKYSSYPAISAAESETEKYFNNFISSSAFEGSCKAVCISESDKISVSEIIFSGSFDEYEKNIIKEEVRRVCGEKASIIFQEKNDG